MAHNEAPVGRERVSRLIVTPEKTTVAAGNAGTVLMSGAKLLFDNGTAWETITSS